MAEATEDLAVATTSAVSEGKGYVRGKKHHFLTHVLPADAGGSRQARTVLSQSSYYSHDDVRLHFGLGGARKADRIEVRWPRGGVDTLTDVAGGRVVAIKEGSTK